MAEETKNVLASKTIQGIVSATVPTVYTGIELVRRVIESDNPLKESESVIVPLLAVFCGIVGAGYAIYGRFKASKGLTIK